MSEKITRIPVTFKERDRKLCQLCLNIHDRQAELAKITPG